MVNPGLDKVVGSPRKGKSVSFPKDEAYSAPNLKGVVIRDLGHVETTQFS